MKRTTFLAVIVCGSVMAADPKPRGWKPSFERLQRCAASLPAEFQKPVPPRWGI